MAGCVLDGGVGCVVRGLGWVCGWVCVLGGGLGVWFRG